MNDPDRQLANKMVGDSWRECGFVNSPTMVDRIVEAIRSTREEATRVERTRCVEWIKAEARDCGCWSRILKHIEAKPSVEVARMNQPKKKPLPCICDHFSNDHDAYGCHRGICPCQKFRRRRA